MYCKINNTQAKVMLYLASKKSIVTITGTVKPNNYCSIIINYYGTSNTNQLKEATIFLYNDNPNSISESRCSFKEVYKFISTFESNDIL